MKKSTEKWLTVLWVAFILPAWLLLYGHMSGEQGDPIRAYCAQSTNPEGKVRHVPRDTDRTEYDDFVVNVESVMKRGDEADILKDDDDNDVCWIIRPIYE